MAQTNIKSTALEHPSLLRVMDLPLGFPKCSPDMDYYGCAFCLLSFSR